MNQQALHNSYKDTQLNGETVRESESRALLNCSARLELVRDPNTSREDLGIAVKLNQRLWTIFQVSLCEPSNPLPKDLRQTLLNLSGYVDKTSFQILGNNDRDKLNSLININRTLAKGLSVKQKTEAPAPTTKQTSTVFTSV